jgi:UPF0755 protein
MRLFAAIAFVLLAVTAAVSWYAWRDLNSRALWPQHEIAVSVPPGASFRSVAEQLHRSGVVRHPQLLTLWARYTGEDRKVRAGRYRVREPLSPLELLRLLQSGQTEALRITIPEGFTVLQIADLLEREGFGGRDALMCGARDAALLLDLDLPASGVEGYLFPDTYALDWNMEPAEIIRLMVGRFRQNSETLRAARTAAGMSEVEMVTLASLIERETGLAEERRLISGVFHNRLRIGMPLQSDPTVIYGLVRFDGNLTRQDLDHPSRYNTYRHRGLPPGPISNPGRAALESAVNPADTKALYFVSRNDGSHEFSVSLEQHNRAVRKYQKRPAR